MRVERHLAMNRNAGKQAARRSLNSQPRPLRYAAVLWTGGKDSSLALYEAARDGYRIHCLVTFAPRQPEFLAHPLAFIQLQAQALGLPHYVFPIHEPYAEAYEAALRRLKNE